MFNAIAPVAQHLTANRAKYAGAAAIISGAAFVNKRAKLWTLLLTDPDEFNAQYPPAK